MRLPASFSCSSALTGNNSSLLVSLLLLQKFLLSVLLCLSPGGVLFALPCSWSKAHTVHQHLVRGNSAVKEGIRCRHPHAGTMLASASAGRSEKARSVGARLSSPFVALSTSCFPVCHKSRFPLFLPTRSPLVGSSAATWNPRLNNLAKKNGPSVSCLFADKRWKHLVAKSEEHHRIQPVWRKGAAVDVLVIPILADNYSYIIKDPKTGRCACVDPAEPSKVISQAENHDLPLEMVLCTHHHVDHAGGNHEMRARLPHIEVVGSSYERTNSLTQEVQHKDVLSLGEAKIEVLYTPCHTAGHVLYLITNEKEDPVLFSGDTLFVGGCGKFLEGSANQMVHALRNVIGALPPNTRVFCGHEYTLSNLRFALTVDPNNTALKEKYEWAKSQADNFAPTVPSTLQEEKTYNPFMRIDQESVKAMVPGGFHMTHSEIMGALRNLKNIFK